jgi:TolB protein
MTYSDLSNQARPRWHFRLFGCVIAALLTLTPSAPAQEAKLSGDLFGKGGKPKMAVTDLRGGGRAAAFMSTFNGTLFADLQGSGLFDMVPKTSYPLTQPQRPEDFRPESGTGLALKDWSSPPPNASHLALGYTADQNGTFVIYGYLFDVRQQTTQGAQMMAKRYFETMDDNGARKGAHEFANDIIAMFGGGSLTGSKIYFISNRTGTKEVWVMDYDGQNQRQLTHSRSINITPAVSPDGSLLAYTSFRSGRPQLDVLETATGRLRGFLNPGASVNSSPAFTPDGKTLYFASTVSGGAEQIYRCGITGSGLSRVSHSTAIETEPKVNPKNPSELVFVSGRTGPQQVFRMNAEGLDVERLTDGTGEASNPSWHSDGQHILFSWTRGYAKGDWNVFLMDVASRRYDQLTHSEGRNENPVWAPDGRHLVFMSTRGGAKQIWTMLADGTGVTRLTNQGENTQPVWSK